MTVKLVEVRDINNDNRKYFRVETPNEVHEFKTSRFAEAFIEINHDRYEYETVYEEM